MIRSLGSRLRANNSGVAAVEFALSAPVILTLFLSGAELTNFAVAKLRVSQIALHVADNSSRIGTASLLTNPQISESQINDLLVGANLQAGGLDLQHRGRVVLSSLEQMASPNQTKMYVHWQRCYGNMAYSGQYPQGQQNLTAYGAPNKQVTSIPSGSAVMYVEVAYNYKPLISAHLVPTLVLKDVAAMVLRDSRDLTQVYNTEGATVSSCS